LGKFFARNLLRPTFALDKHSSTSNPSSHKTFEQVIAQCNSIVKELVGQVKKIRFSKRTVLTAASFVLLALLAFGGVLGFNWFQMRSAQSNTINQAQALMTEAGDPAKSSDIGSLKGKAQKLNEAIGLLKGIEDRPGSLYSQAQTELAKGRSQLEAIEKRIDAETSVSQSLTAIDKLAQENIALLQSAPHPVEKWRQAQTKLEQAIKQIEELPQDSYAATDMQSKLDAYRKSQSEIAKRLAAEEKASQVFQVAESIAQEAIALTEDRTEYELADLQQSQALWVKAINSLKTVPKQSAAYRQVASSTKIYTSNYREVTSGIKKMQSCLKRNSSFCGYVYLSLKRIPTTRISNLDESFVEQDSATDTSY